MPKIALASDLHLEYADIDLKNTEGADVLILSGDIMTAEELRKAPRINLTDMTQEQLDKQIMFETGAMKHAKRFRGFLDRVSAEFPKVISIAGTHEFYHGKWNQTIEVLRKECAYYPNIYFLERDTIVLDDYVFIGATLWTDCNKFDPLTLHNLCFMMSDFQIIKNEDRGYTRLQVADTYARHKKTLLYFKSKLSEHASEKVVIVGHHTPSTLSTHDRYKHEHVMNGGYHSDLSELILDNPQIKLWVHGHTHDPFDYTIGQTRVTCNPRGYVGYEKFADKFTLKFMDI